MIQDIDFSILNWIQDHLKCGFLDFFMPKITLLGEHGIFFLAVGVLLLFFKRSRRTGVTVISGMAGAYILINLIVKNVVNRLRPFQINTAVELMVKAPHDASFPSGHAMHAFIFATVLMCYDKRLGIPAVIIAALVSFSRLYLYVHFPSDVLAGIALGMIFGLISVWISNRIAERHNRKKAVSAE